MRLYNDFREKQQVFFLGNSGYSENVSNEVLAGYGTRCPGPALLAEKVPRGGTPLLATEDEEAMRIGKILAEVVKERQWDQRLGMHLVFHFWDEIAGGEIARQAQPVAIRGTVLWVSVPDSLWMQRLHLGKSALLEEINRRLPGSQSLSDIRFQLGRPPLPGPAHGEEARPLPPPDKEELQRYERIFSAVPDEDARGALLRLWLKSRPRTG